MNEIREKPDFFTTAAVHFGARIRSRAIRILPVISAGWAVTSLPGLGADHFRSSESKRSNKQSHE